MPKKPKLSKFKKHKIRWQGCKACGLCKTRSRVVLLRGKVPADILFLGEAPGPSENSLGKPFIGPSGGLLDHIIEEAVSNAGVSMPRIAFTNMVGCVPYADEGHGVRPPDKDEMEACSPRLQEVVEIVRAPLLVMVGKEAAKHAATFIDWDFKDSIDMVHPGYIIKLSIVVRGLAIQKATVNLRDMLERNS